MTAYPKIGQKARAYRITSGTHERIVSDPHDALVLIETAIGNGGAVSLEHGVIYTRSDTARIFTADPPRARPLAAGARV